MFSIREEHDEKLGRVFSIYRGKRRVFWSDSQGEAIEFLDELAAEYGARDMD